MPTLGVVRPMTEATTGPEWKPTRMLSVPSSGMAWHTGTVPATATISSASWAVRAQWVPLVPSSFMLPQT